MTFEHNMRSEVTSQLSMVTVRSVCFEATWSTVKLSGGLWRYSNKIESVVLRKCPYYHYLTKKVIPQ